MMIGRLREKVLPDGIQTSYGLDVMGRLESLTHTKNGDILDAFQYSYDPAGNITEIEKHRAGVEQDHLGSPVRLLGENGTGDVLAFDEFGVVTIDSQKAANPFGFTGYQNDDISGMLFAQARYYDPRSSRMISEDPARSGQNWYTYCGNRPLRFVDPSGLTECDLLRDIFRWSRDPELSIWNAVSGGGLTYLQKTTLLTSFYGTMHIPPDQVERERIRQLVIPLMTRFEDDPEKLSLVRAFAQGQFAMPVNPVPEGGDMPRADWPSYLPQHGGGYHGGRDIGVALGTPIVSGTAGRVVSVVTGHPDGTGYQNHSQYGNHVVIQLFDGTRITYAHMQNVALPVRVGDIVRPGDHIGNVGSSGNSSSNYNHLHVEIRTPQNNYNDYRLRNNPNPADYMPGLRPQ